MHSTSRQKQRACPTWQGAMGCVLSNQSHRRWGNVRSARREGSSAQHTREHRPHCRALYRTATHCNTQTVHYCTPLCAPLTMPSLVMLESLIVCVIERRPCSEPCNLECMSRPTFSMIEHPPPYSPCGDAAYLYVGMTPDQVSGTS